jgi:hypothetical protein
MKKMDKFSEVLRLTQYTMRYISNLKQPFSLNSMTQKDVCATWIADLANHYEFLPDLSPNTRSRRTSPLRPVCSCLSRRLTYRYSVILDILSC